MEFHFQWWVLQYERNMYMRKPPLSSIIEASEVPQPMIDGVGATDPGPRNVLLDLQNPDVLTPPRTDRGTIPNLKFSFSNAHNRLEEGGWAREVTVRELPIATTLAGVNMRLTAGGVRELHWHPNADEWQYYIEGNGRMTVFASGGKARTFDYQAGDVGYLPFAMGHYVENTGETPLRFLEMFKSNRFADVSLHQWMALTPPELVQDTLHLNQTVMNVLQKQKQPVVI
jgi:oxalate decarboxylase